MRTGILGPGLALALCAAQPLAAQVIDRRADCSDWQHVPASDTLGSPATAMLFCSDADTQKEWLALRIDCRTEPVAMVVHYQPGFAYSPPPPPAPKPEPVLSAQEAEDRAAVALLSSLPYEDSGVTVIPPAEVAQGHEMVFLDFQSFGYTGIAKPRDAAFVFEEKQPLSPIFSRIISGNFADFKLLNAGITERFPLRGSGKALRPVVETCRIAKREADRAGN